MSRSRIVGVLVVGGMLFAPGTCRVASAQVAPAFSARKFPGKKTPRPAASEPAPASSVLAPVSNISLPLTAGTTVGFPLPPGWSIASAPPIDLTDLKQVPGAKQIVQQAWGPSGVASVNAEGGGYLRVACVEAPSDRWSTGAQDVVFEWINSVVRKQIEKSARIGEFRRNPWRLHDHVAVQRYSFRAKQGAVNSAGGARVLENDTDDAESPTISGIGKNLIAFTATKVIVCSALCAEQGENKACGGSIERLQLKGPLVEEPSGGSGFLVQLGRVMNGSVGPWILAIFALGLAFASAGMTTLLRGLWLRGRERRQSGETSS